MTHLDCSTTSEESDEGNNDGHGDEDVGGAAVQADVEPGGVHAIVVKDIAGLITEQAKGITYL